MLIIYLSDSFCCEYAPLSLRSLARVFCRAITWVNTFARVRRDASLDRIARLRRLRVLVVPIVDWWYELSAL